MTLISININIITRFILKYQEILSKAFFSRVHKKSRIITLPCFLFIMPNGVPPLLFFIIGDIAGFVVFAGVWTLFLRASSVYLNPVYRIKNADSKCRN